MRRKALFFKLAVAVALVPHAATAETPLAVACLPDPVAQVAGLLAGSFDTARQFEATPARLKVPPSVAGQWLDRQHARVTRFSSDAIGFNLLFVEWRSGGPGGPVSRQRVWAVDRDFVAGPCAVKMRFYTLRAPLTGPTAEVLARLTDKELIGYPGDCDVRWTGRGTRWRGRIDPKDCRIVAQSGRGMRLDVTIRATASGFTYREAGILDSGAQAFAVPPTTPYRFERVPGR